MSIKREVQTAVEQLMPELASLNRFLYDNPELAYEEVKAQAEMVRLLDSHGFTCEIGSGGFDTAFSAAWTGTQEGPVIAFVAEYDALPEMGHGCGHNLIAASTIGAALALKKAVPDLPGTIKVIGTPGEETAPSTKRLMYEAGAFAGVDACLTMHGDDRTCTGNPTLAVDSIEFIFRGVPAHAAKFPFKGVSALDSAVIAITALEFLREHVRNDVRLHGVILEGGQRANTVPSFSRLSYYVRAADRPYLDSILPRVYDCARAGALATGAELEIKSLSKMDNVVCIPSLDKVLLDNAVDCGATSVRPPGQNMGSNDLGDLSQRVPCGKLKVAFVPDGCPNHSPEWAAASITPAGLQAIAIAAAAMATTAYDLVSGPQLLTVVKAEHASLLQQQTEACT